LASSLSVLTLQEVEAQSTINKTKQIVTLLFEDQPASYTNLYHSFDPLGVVTVTNDQKDIIKLYLLDINAKTNVELVRVSTDIIGYKQTWNDKDGSYIVWTYFDFVKSNNSVKITYTGNLPQSGTITQKIELPSTKTTAKGNIPLFQRYNDKSKTISNTEIDTEGITLSGIGFSWGDAPNATYSSKNNIIELGWSVNTTFIIDPSTVGLSTSNRAIGFSNQRHNFYAANLHWVFYSNGTDAVYRTSINGINWSGETVFRAGCVNGYYFSIYFDGTYLHYCFNNDVANTIMYYRRGTPNTDSTITWSAAEQTAIAAIAGVQYRIPSIAVDSAGYAYIGWRNMSAAGTTAANVTKSGANNGTWGATPASFPFTINGTIQGWRVNVLPLTATKMAVIYGTYNQPIRCQTYNGTGWNPIEVTSTVQLYLSETGAVTANGSDNIHIFTQNDINYNLDYMMYQYSTNTFVNISQAYISGLPTSCSTLTYDNNNNILYAIWTNTPTSNKVWYKKYNPTTLTWDTNPTLFADETVTGFEPAAVIVSNYSALSGVVAAIYETGAASPYNIRYTWTTTANITINNAKVFTNYIETGDWLITLLYQNFTQPYYTQGADVSEYFYIQLTTGNTTLAQTKCPAWGYMPGCIYLNSGQVESLEWGYPYVVQLYGNFSGYPIAQYTLTLTDWLGADLTRLDSWVRSSMSLMEAYYGITLTTYVAGKGIVLNETGGAIFDTCMPTLSSIRPNLFQIVTTIPGYTPETFTGGTATAWQTLLGPQLTAAYTNLGTTFNISGGTVGAVSGFVFYAVVAALAFPAGSAIAAISIPFVILLVVWYTGLLPMAALGFICAIAAFFLIYQFWWLKAG
jgi:hypothetical protein